MQENENFIHSKYGYCYYYVEPNAAMIYNLYVEPEYRRKGHAKKLVEMVIREIREVGYSGEIQVEANPREGSISVERLTDFYSRMGLTNLS